MNIRHIRLLQFSFQIPEKNSLTLLLCFVSYDPHGENELNIKYYYYPLYHVRFKQNYWSVIFNCTKLQNIKDQIDLGNPNLLNKSQTTVLSMSSL